MIRNVGTLCVIQANSFFFGTKFVIFWFKTVNSINFSNYLEKIQKIYIIKLGGREID